MGARATIRIIHPTSDTPIHLYTHWTGNRITEVLIEGLNRAMKTGRLSDYQYATRIIFDTLTGLTGDDLGFGICIGDEGQPQDVEYPTLSVVWGHQWAGDEPMVSVPDMGIYTAREFVERFAPADTTTTS